MIMNAVKEVKGEEKEEYAMPAARENGRLL